MFRGWRTRWRRWSGRFIGECLSGGAVIEARVGVATRGTRSRSGAFDFSGELAGVVVGEAGDEVEGLVEPPVGGFFFVEAGVGFAPGEFEAAFGEESGGGEVGGLGEVVDGEGEGFDDSAEGFVSAEFGGDLGAFGEDFGVEGSDALEGGGGGGVQVGLEVFGAVAVHDGVVVFFEDLPDAVDEGLDGFSAEDGDGGGFEGRAGEGEVDVADFFLGDDADFCGVFEIEDAVADIVGGFGEEGEGVAGDGAVGLFGAEVGRDGVEEFFFGGEDVVFLLGEGAGVGGIPGVFDHGAQGGDGEAEVGGLGVVGAGGEAEGLGVSFEDFEVVAQGRGEGAGVWAEDFGGVHFDPFADGVFAGVSEGRVADVVGEAGCLDDGEEVVG